MATTSNTPSNTPSSPPGSSNEPKLLMKAAFTELVAVNFQISPKILQDRVPRGMELDYFNDETYVTLLCMVMRKVGMLGVTLSPGFVELSMRFYVRRINDPVQRKGTCSIRNYVSSSTGAFLLGQRFESKFPKLKMKCKNSGFHGGGEIPEVEYQWKVDDHWNKLRIRGRSQMKNSGQGTKVGFILEHSNHYLSRDGKTLEYPVKRPEWSIWDAAQANFTCDVQRLFGKEFVKPLARRPASVFVSKGSDVFVYRPNVVV